MAAESSAEGTAATVGGAAAAELYSEAQLAFCRALPKIELHAHLNGSIRESTIRSEHMLTDNCSHQL